MRNALFILLLFFGSCFLMLKLHEGNSLALAGAPITHNADGTWKKLDFTFRAMQDITVEARVLGVARYTDDFESAICPVDLALGWGPMADPENIRQISVHQSNRWYYWQSARPPIPPRQVELSSANMHMVPSTPELDSRLRQITRGQMVRISGKLVEITGVKPGWRWKSSTTREDTGHGSCEIIYVEKLDLLPEK